MESESPLAKPAYPDDSPYRVIYETKRPSSTLLTYLVLRSMLFGPLAPVLVIQNVILFYTLRYEFTDKGIKQSWGRLWRKEIYLTYARIQDIHVSRDVFERWMGLATIAIQTASGSSEPEMTIRGVPEFTILREFLYKRMAGIEAEEDGTTEAEDPLRTLLVEILAELKTIRARLTQSER